MQECHEWYPSMIMLKGGNGGGDGGEGEGFMLWWGRTGEEVQKEIDFDGIDDKNMVISFYT